MSSSWLLKTEPTTYSYDQLEKEGRTTWDGVRNNLALAHLRTMKAGDRLLIYHTGAEKAVIGLAKVAKAAYPDPKQDDPKHVVVDVIPEHRLERPTGDIDVWEVLPSAAKAWLQEVAGAGSDLHRKHRLYLQIVSSTTLPESYSDRLIPLWPE